MPGESFDDSIYRIERQRHEGFVGRAALLGRLDRLLGADERHRADRWVVVTGGPGMGKSALLAEWLARREAAGEVVPHHFIRRGEYDWDDPAKLVGSLVAQLEACFPDRREPEVDTRRHPAARLAAMLARVSAGELAPRGARLVVMIDGLDEYDPPAGAATADPLAAFLPHSLPRGVSFLCATRPKHPYLELLAARDGELLQIDLDEQELAEDNAVTVRAFWERAAPLLDLDARFVQEAAARACGNLQHAATLRRHLAGLPAAARRALDIPRGLAALLAKSWRRIAADPIARHGLGILCAAREALTLDELAVAAGWSDAGQREAFVRGTRELLVETKHPDGEGEYRLHHDSIRMHVAKELGAEAIRERHRELAQRLATWPSPGGAAARRYALRHGLIHRVEAADWKAAAGLAANLGYLEAKCRELGPRDAEADVARVAERCRASGDAELCQRLADLARALACESRWLWDAPEALAPLLWNRLRRMRQTEEKIETRLQVPAGATFLRVRCAVPPRSAALVRDLVGHSPHEVIKCAVTPDSKGVVSASFDRTLKVWDLGSGRLLRTLVGHTRWVTACAVMADGRRVVSGADDGILKVWDLESGRELATLRGHTGQVNACAAAADGPRVVSASNDGTLRVWDVERGCELATLEGHADWVRTCALTPDGQRVVSGSYDGTLKVWDLESGRVLATFEGHTDWVRACAVTADGRRVVSGSRDGTLRVWDLESGRTLVTMTGNGGWVLVCAVTPDGRHIVSGSLDGTLQLWDLESGRMLAVLRGHTDWVRSCVVTGDGRHAVSASGDGTLKVWDLARARAIGNGEADRVTACAISPDGRRVIWRAGDGTPRGLDLEDGGELGAEEVHAAGNLEQATARDAASVRVRAGLEVRAGPMLACAVTEDGRRAVTASADRTLRVWDVETGECLFTHRGDAAFTAVAATGACIAAGDANGEVCVLDWPPRRAALPTATPGPEAAPGARPAREPPRRHTILFLAANPGGTVRIALDEEARAIQEALERSRFRDRFELVTRWATQPDDLLRELVNLQPTVLHFSGHGGGDAAGEHRTGPRREFAEEPAPAAGGREQGLVFHHGEGRARLVSSDALAKVFGAAGASVRLVILNACHSEDHIEVLRAHVDCVVGMSGSICDAAARRYASGFYTGLGARQSVAAAHVQGCAAISLAGLPDADLPRLCVRAGASAERLVLAEGPP
ncbi:AAA family ATPase [Polyangium mundeleinium]|uniref:AAA family ATPase n=1 Tax=Polyangium mundeleinium TaxID=2995306 RepID=A0ABT5F0J3_9BACT|nr:AAA family ATPase [Polyangium mundeleinium]MDC0747134.1 AAA family ATPase [Polyangium mundeleinium]